MVEKVVVIDCDGGLDDALAIFLAVAAHKVPTWSFRVVGITCVSGNTTVDNACVNVTRTLKAADALEIPIYRGCEGPMAVPYNPQGYGIRHHGSDGFGDVGLSPEEPKIEKEHAVLALIRLAKEYAGRLSILAIGPLTNIAMAVKLEPSIMRQSVKEIYIMGGNIEPVSNATFNFHADPEAAAITLADYNCPIVILPYETCKRENHKEYRLHDLANLETPQAELLNKIEHHNLQKSQWSPCDPLTAAVLIEPKVITDARELQVTVERSGSHTRGLMVIEQDGEKENATVIYGTDNSLYRKLLLWGLGGSSYTRTIPELQLNLHESREA